MTDNNTFLAISPADLITQQQKQTQEMVHSLTLKYKKICNCLNIRLIKILQRTKLSKILFYSNLVM